MRIESTFTIFLVTSFCLGSFAEAKDFNEISKAQNECTPYFSKLDVSERVKNGEQKYPTVACLNNLALVLKTRQSLTEKEFLIDRSESLDEHLRLEETSHLYLASTEHVLLALEYLPLDLALLNIFKFEEKLRNNRDASSERIAQYKNGVARAMERWLGGGVPAPYRHGARNNLSYFAKLTIRKHALKNSPYSDELQAVLEKLDYNIL